MLYVYRPECSATLIVMGRGNVDDPEVRPRLVVDEKNSLLNGVKSIIFVPSDGTCCRFPCAACLRRKEIAISIMLVLSHTMYNIMAEHPPPPVF